MNSSNSLLDAFEPSPSTSVTSRTQVSTVRPRNRRLISIADEEDDDNLAFFSPGATPLQSRGTTPSPYTSARASPLPSTHPSRPTGDNFGNGASSEDYFATGGAVKGARAGGVSRSSFAGGIFESSWSSLQGLASSVLGVPEPSSASTRRRRKPSKTKVPTLKWVPSSSSTWGPSAPTSSHIGAGTKEERQALVQAKKRETLLLADGDSVSDLRGRYKRRDSTERPDLAAADPDLDEDALVYVHHVAPTDTITGVTIRYGCQPAIMRKANGFWPSDSIQARKTVLLPVEACSVKGRRLPGKPDEALLDDEPPQRDSIEDPNGSTIVPVSPPPVQETHDESGAKKDTEKTWKHEAWVLIEGFPAAVEIGRVPRRTLGFFPRSRRKSLTTPYSDADTDTLRPLSSDRVRAETGFVSPSWTGSPGPSTHRSVSPPGIPPLPSWARKNSSNSLPHRGHRRQRSSIQLFGPGGVGTLDKDVFAPGPAPDGLNEFFAQHLPALTAAPPHPAPPLAQRKASFESTSTAISATSSAGLENVGGAIEGWMRKMATRAKAGLNELQQGGQGSQAHRQTRGIGIGGIGDLIELNDGLEGMTPPLSTAGARSYMDVNTSTAQQQSSDIRGDVSNLRERVLPPTSVARSRHDRYKDD